MPPCCPKSDADRAALQAFEDEGIDPLYVLNAERAREEARSGVAKRGCRGSGGSDAATAEGTPAVRPVTAADAGGAGGAKKGRRKQG